MFKRNDANTGEIASKISRESLQKIIDEHSDWLKLAFPINPPELGSILFVTKLEYLHFEPDTEKNAEFGMVVSDNGVVGATALVFVPSGAKDIVDKLAEECHLKQTLTSLETQCGGEVKGTVICLETCQAYEDKDYVGLLRKELDAASEIHAAFDAKHSKVGTVNLLNNLYK